MTAIIIDDEEPARALIAHFLKQFPEITLIGVAENGFEGIKIINEKKPDLIFLDIQMPKLTGFEMIELIEDKPVIIFSTAYDEFALKAFELNAVDYLLKPYHEERFRQAVEKAVQRIKSNENPAPKLHATVEAYKQESKTLNRIVVKEGSKIHVIPVDDVHFFEAQDDYVAIQCEKTRFSKQMTMKYLEENLSKSDFLRVHRSYILNLREIDKIELFEKESYLALLKTGRHVPVSKSGYQKLREVLGI